VSTSPAPLASPDEMRDMFRTMTLIRRFEEKASEQYMAGRIGGFLHLAIGEEAAMLAGGRPSLGHLGPGAPWSPVRDAI
jgi:TPP-dependent pyruvate/acetoin dehydrogenase alpha subunit